MNRRLIGALVLLIAAGVPGLAAAADVVLLSSNGMRAVLEEVLPRFEQSTMHEVVVRYNVAAELRRRIEAGETFDVAILTAAQLDAVIKGGFVVGGTRVPLAQTPMAIAIRAGASRPDIRTTAALRRALEGVSSIAYAREGAGGVYLNRLLQQLGLTERLAPKLRPVATGVDVGAAVARGDAQIGVLPLSEILPVKGGEVLGPFPSGVQDPVVMVGGVSAGTSQRAAATALLTYLQSGAMRAVLQKKGMEPAHTTRDRTTGIGPH